jgi:hypothetical protein
MFDFGFSLVVSSEMNLIDIFLTTLYSHFCGMQERGRNVIPWLQTVFVTALVLTISIFLLVDILFPDVIKLFNNSELVFIGCYLIMGCFFFIAIKRYFFDSGKNIELSQKYLIDYSSHKRYLFKVIVIAICLIIPVLLGFIIWLHAKPLPQ